MDIEHKSLRIGTGAILCAVILRLFSGGLLDAAVSALSEPEVASVIFYLETGRVLRAPEPQAPTDPEITAPPETTVPEATEPETPDILAAFSSEDAALVEVNSFCGYDADIENLLLQPLSWDLTENAPSVLILHTHTSESYTKTESYTEDSDYRTLNENYNVVSIGARLAQLLEDGGLHVLHDRAIHDYPSYNGAYAHAREYIADYLEQYPSIRMVLDIHRDAMEDTDGAQIGYTVSADGQATAQLMLVIGSDAGGLTHPDWQANMALAVKLHAQLEKNCPGICRPISFRSQRFNQDLSPGALLVEVGAAGNTRAEALLAAEHLAQGILTLAHGTATSDSTTESSGHPQSPG